jgi:hypothetical protein
MKKSSSSCTTRSSTITFHSTRDVFVFNLNNRGRVRKHIEGRSKLDSELWTLGRYLAALANAELLTYPFTATHLSADRESESPDFMLCLLGDHPRIGLEVTEASSNERHRLRIRSEKSAEGIAHIGNDPMVGDELQTWASLMFETVRKKDGKLVGGGWRAADDYDLVVYDNSGVFVDICEAYPILRGLLGPLPHTAFRTASIIVAGGAGLFYDVEGDCRILAIPSN